MRAAPIYAVGLMCCVAAIVAIFYFAPDANQHEFDKAQARALSTEDPWTAYSVYKEEIRWFEHCGRTTRCPKGFREDTIPQALLVKALDNKSSDAYIELYSSRLDWSRFLKIQTDYAPKLLALVDSQAWENTSNEFAMYFTAARVLEGGDFITADTPRAAAYLVKAWQKGAVSAPLYLSRLYKRTNDFHNAYLWSLRCVGKCRFNSARESFDGYQSGLSNSEIVAIQKLVDNQKVISVSADSLLKI
jgi:hypothetical protein